MTLISNNKRIIQDVPTLPAIGESRYIYLNTTDGYFYNWNEITSQFNKLSNTKPIYSDSVANILVGGEEDGQFLYITNTGDEFGTIDEVYVWIGGMWQSYPLPVINNDSPASILAANACVNNVVNVPTGEPNDVYVVGAGGDFADLQTALLDASVVEDTILRLVSNVTTSTTINVDKKVVIDGNGFNLESATNNPVNMLNITAGATVKNFGKISHLKTTNTSVETVIAINSPDPVYVYNNIIETQEFGIVARGSYFIGKNTFKYVGASATNSHRFIMLNGNSGESRIYENNLECSLKQGTTRYSNFIYATQTTGTIFEGKLFINDNTQTAGDLRQFYLHDSGVPTGMELYVANNTFNDFNGGVGIFGVAIYNGYKKIGIYNNTQGADSAGNYKGLFYIDGTGAINEDVILEYGDNTQGTTALRADYLSYAYNGSSEIALKNTVTFVDLKVKVLIKDALSGLGLLIQDLKGRKTYLSGVTGTGTEEDPYIVQSSFSLSDLTDIVTSGATNGQVLMFNSTTGKWENTSETKANFAETNSLSSAYIQNKPTVTSGVGTPIGTATIGSIYLENDALGNSIGSYVYNGTSWVSLAFNQIQADWTEVDSSDPSFIKNKPTLANVAISGDYSSLLNKPTIPSAQIQSDYTQTDNTQLDFIKNKPDLSVFELVANRGVPNGFAPLNGSGTIDAEYLNITGTEYKGTWNPTTNTPTLSNTTGTNGWFYYVSEDGSVDLGAGTIDFQEGNIVIFDDVSNEWKRVGGQQLITNDLDASLTDFSNPLLYFYGGITDAGDWQVNKWDMVTNTKTIANLTNNSGTTNLATAWTNRLTLNYI